MPPTLLRRDAHALTSRMVEPAWLRAVAAMEVVQPSLEGLERGSIGKRWVPSWILLDAHVHRPRHTTMAILSRKCRVARPQHARTRLVALMETPTVQEHLEILEARLDCQTWIPIGVLHDSDLHGPLQVLETRVALLRSAAPIRILLPTMVHQLCATRCVDACAL